MTKKYTSDIKYMVNSLL